MNKTKAKKNTVKRKPKKAPKLCCLITDDFVKAMQKLETKYGCDGYLEYVAVTILAEVLKQKIGLKGAKETLREAL